MPRELFSSSVVGVSTAARRGRLLPISVAFHAAIFGALFVLPLASTASLAEPKGIALRCPIPPPLRLLSAPPGGRHTSPHAGVRADVAPLTTPAAMPTVEPIGPGNLHADDDIAGGVVSGVPGGVVGGRELIAIEPPPTPGPAKPLRVSSGIQAPVKIRDVRPVYPAIAQSARVEGLVILEAVIDERGHVTETRVLRSISLLDEAAMAAVRQWVFSPTILNGQPIAVVMTVTVQFTLQK